MTSLFSYQPWYPPWLSTAYLTLQCRLSAVRIQLRRSSWIGSEKGALYVITNMQAKYNSSKLSERRSLQCAVDRVATEALNLRIVDSWDPLYWVPDHTLTQMLIWKTALIHVKKECKSPDVCIEDQALRTYIEVFDHHHHRCTSMRGLRIFVVPTIDSTF